MKSIFKLLATLFVLTPSFVMAAEAEDKCLGKPVIELVTFSVNKGVTDAQIKLTAKKITPSLKKYVVLNQAALFTTKTESGLTLFTGKT